MLVVEDVSKTFVDGERLISALQSVSFTVEQGEFVCLLGPSGSGKSTLLRVIGGLLTADGGAVWFDDERIDEPHADIGFVFQSTNLMPWRTVLENVLLPIEVQQGKVSEGDRRRAGDLLALVGLEGFMHTYPKRLSGGMSQRVVLARTLLHNPKLLLMDEPFGALDALTRERLNLELLRIQRLQTKTVLMVTHSIAEAVFLSDRVIVLGDRPASVIAQVSIDLPRPRRIEMTSSEYFGQLTMQVREYIGVM